MIYECHKPTREMLKMKPSELKTHLAADDDLEGISIPLEVTSIDELMHIYRLSPDEANRIEATLKRQGIYVCQKFVVRSVNRRPW